ncbi:MerR family transcriptional regulator [Planomonospora venezuelensis]|uniref:DNA-binding transcriptional MerR regulator n=1 Tax=Planomonospora venezuelensis TaxID=1999 RepID=A0A841D9L4_PLAVE|nr:MerR family transcriptional regulator [Planomonospora venezuelensis]MBB5966881.1 DNA-binding transcriptional MerR regulator [Planomonospora venezuelensis]GIN02382.1 MerR family transcriptional regulator [Planomonospora venezuelensis]
MKSTAAESLEIGELAGRYGLAAHVLRHWEAMGLLSPARQGNGRRRYGPEDEARVALIVRAKEAGASLEQIRDLVTAGSGARRREILARHRAGLARRMERLRASMEMVEHVLDCPEEDFFDCPEFRLMLTAGPDRRPCEHG